MDETSIFYEEVRRRGGGGCTIFGIGLRSENFEQVNGLRYWPPSEPLSEVYR